MDEFNSNIARISCPTCNRVWQVLNEEGTDWDEQKTAEQYQNDVANCAQCSITLSE